MAIYTTRYGKVFGKQIPTLHSPRGLGIGPAGGIGRLARIARFAIKYRKPLTGIGSVAIGATVSGVSTGIDLDGQDVSPDKFGQALRPLYQQRSRFRSSKRNGRNRHHYSPCHCKCVRR